MLHHYEIRGYLKLKQQSEFTKKNMPMHINPSHIHITTKIRVTRTTNKVLIRFKYEQHYKRKLLQLL